MTDMMKTLVESQARYIALRHQLHSHPEIGLEEYHTSDLVAEKLSSWGYKVNRGLAQTGVVGSLTVGDGKKVLGLRADMDALPMQEQSGKAWASSEAGKFHGCGHDGHTTILLCAAEYLAKTRNFNGTLNLIFQPGEELLYGGRVMLDDGLFATFPCDAIFALHNMPGLKKGTFHFKKGPMMASSDTIIIDVNGVGGHGAYPEKTIDAGMIACYIAVALQTIVSRNVVPFQPAVVTVGSIQSGLAPNIINEHARLQLSVRALNADVRRLMVERITEIAQGQAKSFGATVKVDHVNGCPELVNGREATDFAISVAKELMDPSMICEDTHAMMGSEDFAFMLERNPNGSYLMIGAGDEPDLCPVHHPGFDFNDELIIPGARYWCTLAEKFLK
ncbi:M20 aminoacylase family protein [Lelliottia wanjuensis]|uniref:M20 aminoacylase family protein n=1 Tax=Lelliottia wanjuensis TaxID=3050585 RepID=A0AAP4D0C3_9ENTR|nr:MULTISPECIES: M20 aminoacylase family protein [unclassified Lelliottia]MDK9361799.1 M20 aminoacylase family protein [Lelliottia sp. V106_12]MDK9618590.1 M20 aminoacylase family protein [Lelliottia sp. V106_9]